MVDTRFHQSLREAVSNSIFAQRALILQLTNVGGSAGAGTLRGRVSGLRTTAGGRHG